MRAKWSGYELPSTSPSQCQWRENRWKHRTCQWKRNMLKFSYGQALQHFLFSKVYIYMPNLLVASEAVDVVFNNCTVKKDKERWTPEQQEAREEQETSKIPSKGVLKQKSEVSKETKHWWAALIRPHCTAKTWPELACVVQSWRTTNSIPSFFIEPFKKKGTVCIYYLMSCHHSRERTTADTNKWNIYAPPRSLSL